MLALASPIICSNLILETVGTVWGILAFAWCLPVLGTRMWYKGVFSGLRRRA
jgi:hypothetical protein